MPGRKPIKPEDEPRFLAALATFTLRDQAAITLGINVGFRATELLSLNVGDVWQHGRMRACVTVARCRLKGGRGRRRKNISSRTVPLNDAAVAALQKYLFSRFGSGSAAPLEPLFPSRFHGVRLTRWRLNHLVKAVLAKAGVAGAEQFGTHSLRKTFAARIFSATGHDINLTRVALGHAQIGTTQRYLQVDDDDVVRAILFVGKKPPTTLPGTVPAAAGGR